LVGSVRLDYALIPAKGYSELWHFHFVASVVVVEDVVTDAGTTICPIRIPSCLRVLEEGSPVGGVYALLQELEMLLHVRIPYILRHRQATHVTLTLLHHTLKLLGGVQDAYDSVTT
jgi:uncharacterized protein YwlG (UPF0340 family)